MHRSWLTVGVISGISSLLVITLAPNISLMLFGWFQAPMRFHAPRLGSPLALLSSFKLFLTAVATGSSGFGRPPA